MVGIVFHILNTTVYQKRHSRSSGLIIKDSNGDLKNTRTYHIWCVDIKYYKSDSAHSSGRLYLGFMAHYKRRMIVEELPINMDDNYIKMADPRDAPLLTRLIRESFRDVAERFNLTAVNCPKHPSNCGEEWIKKDFNRGVIYYILEHQGEPFGCVALERARPDQCYLERLAVLPGMRKRGFGRTLVEHVFSQAENLGVKEISVGIIAKQTELKNWYQKMGFIVGETKGFDHLPFFVTFMSYPF